MSIALAYDNTLSRVRVTGTAPGMSDPFFPRTSVSSWGTAPTGEVWTCAGGTAADFNVNTGVGKQAHPTVNVFRLSTHPAEHANTDRTWVVFTSVAPAGAEHIIEFVARYVDGSNLYAARLSFDVGGTATLSIRKRVGGGQTILATTTYSPAFPPTTSHAVRFRVDGNILRAKTWQPAFGSEPIDWTLTATASDFSAAGLVGIRTALATGNSNTLPVTLSVDSVVSSGTGVLERSTDEIQWSTVRGGSELAGTPGAAFTVDDYEFAPGIENFYRVRALGFDDTDSITPAMDRVWLKNLRLPYLNREVTVTDWGDEEFPARAGEFPIVGRTYPIAVTDLRLPRQYELVLTTATVAEANELGVCLMAGDPVLVHTPPDCDVPGGYYLVGNVKISRKNVRSKRRYITLPLSAVAIAGPDIVGATTTCAAVLATYATCADVLAANATCQDLLDGIADPEDVIVP